MVQRLAWPWWGSPEVVLASHCSGLVFDFDDAVFLGEGGRPSSSRRRALKKVFEASRHVVAGNSWLADAVQTDVPITVLPTCIDTAAYTPGSRPHGDIPVIGWIGTGTNLPYLERLVDDIHRLRSSGHLFEFRICSDEEPRELARSLQARFVRWTPQEELPFLQSLDIGLMPLPDTDWARGKCSFKIIQYMSVGCPVVASGVGFNCDVVNEDAGFLVRNDDWAEPLSTLIRSRSLRERMGAAARHRAVHSFDTSRAIETYRRILAGLQ